MNRICHHRSRPPFARACKLFPKLFPAFFVAAGLMSAARTAPAAEDALKAEAETGFAGALQSAGSLRIQKRRLGAGIGAPAPSVEGWSAEDDSARLHSQARGKNESYEEALHRYLRRMQNQPDRGEISYPGAGGDSVLDSAVPYKKFAASIATAWESTGTARKAFELVRDSRFLRHDGMPDFLRRSSWLYPDDGCYARAAMMGKLLEAADFARPKKVFIFGDLKVKTANSPDGAVGWWYHVAPIVTVGEASYVLDPAIDPLKPLPLDAWVKTMGEDAATVKLAVCSEHSYAPSSVCAQAPAEAEADAEKDQRSVLPLEWDRVEKLGRNPREVLGDNPPWTKS